MSDYRDRQDAIREEMEREADILRGLGTHMSAADMAAYGRRLDEAALPSREEMDAYYAEEAERSRAEYEEIMAAEWAAMTRRERLEWRVRRVVYWLLDLPRRARRR